MQTQFIPFYVFVDEDLIGRIRLLKNVEPDCLCYEEVKEPEGMVVCGYCGLESTVFDFGLEVFDAVVLLWPFQVAAPLMRIDDGQDLLLLLRCDKIVNISEPFDLVDLFEQHY